MSQQVVFKGVLVSPIERSGDRILVETLNVTDAHKAEIPFKEMRGSTAVFQLWVEESELVPI